VTRATPALELLGIRKRFGSVQALRGADFVLTSGTVHALLGENGAGKSTLMHVAYGMVKADAGEIRVRGSTVPAVSPHAARSHGIGMVHQHFTSIPALSVAENVALFAGWRTNPAALRRRVRDLCARVGLPLEPDERASALSAGLKQRLELLKALAADAAVLLLDEPTAVLAPSEVSELLRVIRRFAEEGGATVLITHKLREALEWADEVTVLRGGTVVVTGPATSFDAAQLAGAMLGDDRRARLGFSEDPLGPVPATVTEPSASPLLIDAAALEVARESGHGTAVREATLQVRAGEIVGIAAVEGNGQRELLRAIAGRLRPLRGRLEVTGPVGFIPEDRTAEGLIPELSLTENMLLGHGSTAVATTGGIIDWSRARTHTETLLRSFGVSAAGPDARAASLSGGNQQRVVIARELASQPAVVVAENPTRGLDLRASDEVHRRLRLAAVAGAAVLFHSTDLDEVLELGRRILVMTRGVLMKAPAGASRAEVGALMLGS
jgi:general nucleoside transport system ATP-binding protein